jgi:hypothetical protein
MALATIDDAIRTVTDSRMSFWYQFPEENRENDIRHPPLTDPTVASIQARHRVRLPQRLVGLLREKNGGYLTDKEFKLKGADYQVDFISGLRKGGVSSNPFPTFSNVWTTPSSSMNSLLSWGIRIAS